LSGLAVLFIAVSSLYSCCLL